jgi:beta-lactamase regulating signal transducer with metallopeptidase domain
MNFAIITSWLLTYLLHSTILLGAAWLISHALADRRLVLQEILLRVALIGGLMTATVQVGLGIEPIGGVVALDGLLATDATTVIEAAATETTVEHGAASLTPEAGARAASLWPIALLSLWVIGSLLAFLALGRSILDLRRLLKTRRFRPAGRLLDRLAAAMRLRRPVRLSTSGAIAVPFATGIRRPEICCPERVGDLAPEHQKSLFAHELAHLARRDPLWQLLYRLGEAVLFPQPLNRFVRRRLEDIAEHLTDERAVACTGDRLGLARCLVVVAHWGVTDSPGMPATAFAAGPRLDRRVKRLISGSIGQHRDAPWTTPLVVAMLIASVLLLPAFMPTAVHANLTPSGSDAAKVRPRSPAEPAGAAPATPVPAGESPASGPPRPAPLRESVPAPEAVPRTVAVPAAPAPAAPSAEPVPEAAPTPRSEPAPPKAPAPEAPTTTHEPPPETDKPSSVESEAAREQARERHREAQRQRAEAEARVRAETRARAVEASELARKAAQRSRLTEAEREKLRSEARELMRQAQLEARERAKISRERKRLSDEEREALRRRAEAVRAAVEERMRETEREVRERARALAEEAEAKRRAEEEFRQRRIPE